MQRMSLGSVGDHACTQIRGRSAERRRCTRSVVNIPTGTTRRIARPASNARRAPSDCRGMITRQSHPGSPGRRRDRLGLRVGRCRRRLGVRPGLAGHGEHLPLSASERGFPSAGNYCKQHAPPNRVRHRSVHRSPDMGERSNGRPVEPASPVHIGRHRRGAGRRSPARGRGRPPGRQAGRRADRRRVPRGPQPTAPAARGARAAAVLPAARHRPADEEGPHHPRSLPRSLIDPGRAVADVPSPRARRRLGP